MAFDSSDLSAVANVYVARFGEGGKFADASLADGLLRFEWTQLTFDELTSAPREVVRRKLLQTTAPSKGEASNDFGRLNRLRHSGPSDLWVAFEGKQMWWTRLTDGPIEQDDTSSFRRTTGWSNRSLTGEQLDFSALSAEVRSVNRTSRSANRPVRDAEHRQAILSALLGKESSAFPLLERARGLLVTQPQRDALRVQWDKLRRPIGWVGEIGTSGHGLQACMGPGKARWCASMYWSNSKSDNAVSFCIHAGRLILGAQERKEFEQWFLFQRYELLGRDAEIRSSEERVQSALRIGFDFAYGLEFATRFAAALDPFAPNPNARWKLPASSVAELNRYLSAKGVAAPHDAVLALKDAVEAGDQTSTKLDDLDPMAISIQQMVRNAHSAAAESGKIRERVTKLKEVRMTSDELTAHLRELIEAQGRRCKLSNLPLHFGEATLGGEVDSERLASLDRIDSSGHYERGNLQVVCWFVNRWKSDDTQENFARLLRLLGVRGLEDGLPGPVGG